MKKQIKLYLAEIGRRGGASKKEQKIEAARKNGKLGGRPKNMTQQERTDFEAMIQRGDIKDVRDGHLIIQLDGKIESIKLTAEQRKIVRKYFRC